jgi:hypothetical protein
LKRNRNQFKCFYWKIAGTCCMRVEIAGWELQFMNLKEKIMEGKRSE